jgi:hypothetical protein
VAEEDATGVEEAEEEEDAAEEGAAEDCSLEAGAASLLDEMLAKSEGESYMGVTTLQKWESRRSGHSQ